MIRGKVPSVIVGFIDAPRSAGLDTRRKAPSAQYYMRNSCGMPENFGFQIVQEDRRIRNPTDAVRCYSILPAFERAWIFLGFSTSGISLQISL